MKYEIFFIPIMIIGGCSIPSKQDSGKLIVDSKLNNKFFDKASIGVQGGPNRVYVDSVLTYSNDSVSQKTVLMNAEVLDMNGRHHPLRTCKGNFINDTLFIEILSTASFIKNRLKIKIVNNNYFAYFVDGNINKEYLAKPISLKVRDKIDKKTRIIYGELEIEFLDSITNNKYLFKGPFVCFVGDFLPRQEYN